MKKKKRFFLRTETELFFLRPFFFSPAIRTPPSIHRIQDFSISCPRARPDSGSVGTRDGSLSTLTDDTNPADGSHRRCCRPPWWWLQVQGPGCVRPVFVGHIDHSVHPTPISEHGIMLRLYKRDIVGLPTTLASQQKLASRFDSTRDSVLFLFHWPLRTR